MKDPVKQKIQELNPEIMELKFDCRIESSTGTIGVFTGVRLNGEVFEIYSNPPGYIHSIPSKLSVILGRPIQLADVLRAIPIGLHLKSLGEQVRLVKDDEGSDVELEYWDLTTDYDSQSDETKRFIGELLGVNK